MKTFLFWLCVVSAWVNVVGFFIVLHVPSLKRNAPQFLLWAVFMAVYAVVHYREVPMAKPPRK